MLLVQFNHLSRRYYEIFMVCCIRYCYIFCISYYGRIGRFIMKICKTCKGNNFVRLKFEGEESTMNCPDCTIDGKRDYLESMKYYDGEQTDKTLPPKKKVNPPRLLTYRLSTSYPTPYFFGHYKEAT